MSTAVAAQRMPPEKSACMAMGMVLACENVRALTGKYDAQEIDEHG
jgi:hypothetical protein